MSSNSNQDILDSSTSNDVIPEEVPVNQAEEVVEEGDEIIDVIPVPAVVPTVPQPSVRPHRVILDGTFRGVLRAFLEREMRENELRNGRPNTEVNNIVNEAPAPRDNETVREANLSTSDPLAAELAVSKEMVDSFGPNGLIEDQEEDVTEMEEMIFKKVLRKKMVCDICHINMKLYRCCQCMYSMCQECSKRIPRDYNRTVSCPHCRKKQETFKQILLPRF